MTTGKLKLIISPDVGALLEAAADGFLEPLRSTPDNPFPSPRYLLALRQGGLRDDLIRLAARKGNRGWFDPPLCVFHELPGWLGESTKPPLGDIERAALLGHVIARAGGKVFGSTGKQDFFLESLDSFFGELVSEGLTPRQFEEAMGPLIAEKQTFNGRKNAELVNLFRSYVAALDEVEVRDGRDGLVASANIIDSDPEGFAARLGERREIRFFGLADLRGGWRRLLHSLVNSPAIDEVRIYATREFSASETETLPAYDVEHLADQPTVAARLFREETGNETDIGSSRFSAIEAPNTERELGEVALQIRRLADDGIPLQRIAVVARRGRPYVDLAVQALERVGVPATARSRIAFNEIPVVKAVLSVLAAASEGWTRQGLAELAGSPYFPPSWTARSSTSSDTEGPSEDSGGGRKRSTN